MGSPSSLSPPLPLFISLLIPSATIEQSRAEFCSIDRPKRDRQLSSSLPSPLSPPPFSDPGPCAAFGFSICRVSGSAPVFLFSRGLSWLEFRCVAVLGFHMNLRSLKRCWISQWTGRGVLFFFLPPLCLYHSEKMVSLLRLFHNIPCSNRRGGCVSFVLFAVTPPPPSPPFSFSCPQMQAGLKLYHQGRDWLHRNKTILGT